MSTIKLVVDKHEQSSPSLKLSDMSLFSSDLSAEELSKAFQLSPEELRESLNVLEHSMNNFKIDVENSSPRIENSTRIEGIDGVFKFTTSQGRCFHTASNVPPSSEFSISFVTNLNPTENINLKNSNKSLPFLRTCTRDPLLLKTRLKSIRGNKRLLWAFPTKEEQAKICDFWFGLGIIERRRLLTSERDGLMKIWKEQKVSICQCIFCRRKREVIEDEIQLLYSLYLEELEGWTRTILEERQKFLESSSSDLYDPCLDMTTSELFLTYEDSESFYNAESLFDQDFSSSDATSQREVAFRCAIMSIANDLLQNNCRRFMSLFEKLAERRMKLENGQNGCCLRDPRRPISAQILAEEEILQLASFDGDTENEEAEVMCEEDKIEEGRRIFQDITTKAFEQRVISLYREIEAMDHLRQFIANEESEDEKKGQKEGKKQPVKQKKRNKKKLFKIENIADIQSDEINPFSISEDIITEEDLPLSAPLYNPNSIQPVYISSKKKHTSVKKKSKAKMIHSMFQSVLESPAVFTQPTVKLEIDDSGHSLIENFLPSGILDSFDEFHSAEIAFSKNNGNKPPGFY